jgi:diguanylate cyclase (GGDEF)-like protein/PAS domain S-box-containing protein
LKDDEFYRAVLDNIADGVYFCDRKRRITFWNQGAERITGYSAAEVEGQSCSGNLLVHVDEHGRSLCRGHCPVAATIEDGASRQAQVYVHHKEGHRVPILVRTRPIYGDDGRVDGVVETFSDNTALLDALQKVNELSAASETDPLTGIGNRRSMAARLQGLITENSRLRRHAGVLFIDIDRFKDVNDVYGHQTGDLVLRMVAGTLEHNLRATDTLARWGGEEFVAFVSRVNRKALGATADKLRALVESSFVTAGGQDVRVTISIGATLLRPDDTVETVIARADSLLYESKKAGRNRVTVAR